MAFMYAYRDTWILPFLTSIFVLSLFLANNFILSSSFTGIFVLGWFLANNFIWNSSFTGIFVMNSSLTVSFVLNSFEQCPLMLVRNDYSYQGKAQRFHPNGRTGDEWRT